MNRGIALGVAADQLVLAIDANVVLVTVVAFSALLGPTRVLVLLRVLGRLLLPYLGRFAPFDRLVLVIEITITTWRSASLKESYSGDLRALKAHVYAGSIAAGDVRLASKVSFRIPAISTLMIPLPAPSLPPPATTSGTNLNPLFARALPTSIVA